MKLDLNFIINGLDGKPLTGTFDQIHVGAIVANSLAFTPKVIDGLPPLRRTILAQDLYKQMPVELTAEEAKAIKSLCTVENGFPPITVSLIHEAINKILE